MTENRGPDALKEWISYVLDSARDGPELGEGPVSAAPRLAVARIAVRRTAAAKTMLGKTMFEYGFACFMVSSVSEAMRRHLLSEGTLSPSLDFLNVS